MGLRRRGVRRHGPARRARESCDIENWTYLGGDRCGSHRRPTVYAAIGAVRRARQHQCHAGWEPRDRQDVLEALASSDDDAHVYVHGFNNSLQFACRTAALLARDRIAICVAWPSNPPLPRSWAIAAVLSVAERNYTAAEQQMQRSVRSVANAALLLRENCKRRLDWTAHSMGCYLLLRR